MAFKMKGSPYAMGTHKTKNTALYAKKKKTERELGKTTTTYTKKSNIYDKDKFDKSKGSSGSIGWSKKYSYEPGGGRSGEGVTAEKVTKGGGKTVQYKDKGKTKVITKEGEAPKVKTKKSGKQYSKAIDKIKKKSGHTERHSGIYQKEPIDPPGKKKNDPFGDEKLKGLTQEKARTRPEKLNPKVEGKIKVLHKARTSPDPVKRPTETLTARLKPKTIEKAMKKATPYEGFKKEGKKVGMVRDMTKPKQVARKKARLVEKPKKKTGKISTKTMELE